MPIFYFIVSLRKELWGFKNSQVQRSWVTDAHLVVFSFDLCRISLDLSSIFSIRSHSFDF